MKGDTIYPVILPVPLTQRKLTGKEKVSSLSVFAREALSISADRSGVSLPSLPKDENGLPMPVDGIYWSLTHKVAYVGGVVSGTDVGIDIEKIRPCSPPLYKKTATAEEWQLSDADPMLLFFRYWTAKESVLKASGSGVWNLRECRIVELLDDTHLTVDYMGTAWLVEQVLFDGHIASVTETANRVDWMVEIAAD